MAIGGVGASAAYTVAGVAWWAAALSVLGAFALGSLSPATAVARAKGLEISRHGSGNPGATNVGRVLGAGWGVAVGVTDVLKGLVPTLAAVHWGSRHLAYAVCVAAVTGHMFSPLLRGHGGKGVATTVGGILAAHWALALALLAVFLLVVLVWRWVAVASVAGAILLLGAGVLALLGVGGADPVTGVWAGTLGLLVVERHIHQIGGLVRGRRS